MVIIAQANKQTEVIIMTTQDLKKLHELLVVYKIKHYKCDHNCQGCEYRTQGLECAFVKLIDDVADDIVVMALSERMENKSQC